MPITKEEIKIRFSYHKPVADQPAKYETVREWARDFASLIVDITPESREQAVALTKLDEVVMWVNAAIARREIVQGPGGAVEARRLGRE